MPANSSFEHFDRLSLLTHEDVKGFVRLRRALIVEMIERPDVSFSKLSALQCEIDCRLATSVAPRQSIDGVMQLLEERVGELKRLSEKLEHLLIVSRQTG